LGLRPRNPEITAPFVNLLLQNARHAPDGSRSVLLWLYAGGKNAFLQDGNNLVLKTDDLVEILHTLKETFPSIERITSYARAKTVSKKKGLTVSEIIRRIIDEGFERLK
jgi:hypothetical protein